MGAELEFRFAIAYLLLVQAAVAIYFRRPARRAESQRLDATAAIAARRTATVFFSAPLLVYIVFPSWLGLGSIALPDAVRWLATAPAVASVLLLVWAYRFLGDNVTAGRSSPAGCRFVARGPYRWLRHPHYAGQCLFFVSTAAMGANWLVGLSAMVGILLLRLAVARREEQALCAAFGPSYREYASRTGSFFFKLGKIKAARYQVPKRFGLAAVLALLTTLAIVFGALKYMNAPPVVYLFVASEIVAICLVQIFFSSVPRGASTVTGAVLLPFWIVVSFHPSRMPAIAYLILVAFVVPFGGLIGYCTGALAAGFFLVMDLVEPYLPGGSRAGPTDSCTPGAGTTAVDHGDPRSVPD